MDTSIHARYVMVLVVFSAVCAIGLANLRLILCMLLRRKVSRAVKIIWPALALLVAFCVVDARVIEPNWVQVTYHEMTTSRLPPGHRFRIVHLTDLHMTRITGRDISMLSHAAMERPDAIVLTGDYTVIKDAKAWSDLEQVARRLTKIAPCYAVEGNWDMSNDMQALRKAGVTILYNWTTVSNRRGDTIALGGAPWMCCGIVPPPSSSSDLYQVLLCHRPESFDAAARCGVDLLLAGHTHGGQVRLPVFGALLPDRQLVGRYQAGTFCSGRTTMFVNRGIGLEGGAAPKVRFWCSPEVAVFDIVGRSK